MGAKFERVRRFSQDDTIHLPKRATRHSAGYDFAVAENTILWPYNKLMNDLKDCSYTNIKTMYDLNDMKELIQKSGAKPTLVPTGIKAKLDPDMYLELAVRSSLPLKSWVVMANSMGIIDADYYGNPSTDGEIFFQLINLSPFPIMLHKGDVIGQGIIKHYNVIDDDDADGTRVGGLGSTS